MAGSTDTGTDHAVPLKVTALPAASRARHRVADGQEIGVIPPVPPVRSLVSAGSISCGLVQFVPLRTNAWPRASVATQLFGVAQETPVSPGHPNKCANCK